MGCAGAATAPEGGGTALVVVDGAPDGALVFVDDVAVAVLSAERPQFVAPAGRHRLRIEAAGHLAHRAEIDLVGGETYDLAVQLWPCFPEVDAECAVAPPEGSGALFRTVDPQQSPR